MLSVVIAYNTVFLTITANQSFLLKLIPVSEADKPSLRKAEKVYPPEIMLQLKR